MVIKNASDILKQPMINQININYIENLVNKHPNIVCYLRPSLCTLKNIKRLVKINPVSIYYLRRNIFQNQNLMKFIVPVLCENPEAATFLPIQFTDKKYIELINTNYLIWLYLLDWKKEVPECILLLTLSDYRLMYPYSTKRLDELLLFNDTICINRNIVLNELKALPGNLDYLLGKIRFESYTLALCNGGE